jgi:glycosyltransferase involved in cell wall biosynthesis
VSKTHPALGAEATLSAHGDPRRVLRLITRLNVGGPARHALLLTRDLAPEYQTTLAAGTPPPEEGELSDPAVPVHRLPLVRPLSPAADARSVAAVRRLLGHHRPDILHTHMAKAGTVGRLAAMSTRPRPCVVHTFHGHVLDGYFSPRTQLAFTRAERWLARHTDALVAVSSEIRDQLLELGIGRPSQFVVIPVGLDLSAFLAVTEGRGQLRSALGLAPETPLVGAVGRLVPIKDNDTLLKAVQTVPGVHLALVGDGELRQQLEARARELGMGDRVHVTGWWDDVAGAVSDLDVVALTSRNEGTPLALIEAGAAGRAVVSTDVGGVRSVVDDGVTGLLAPPGDVAGISAAISRLLADPISRHTMGSAARRRVEERFGHERLVREIRSLYAELLTEPPCRGARSSIAKLKAGA